MPDAAQVALRAAELRVLLLSLPWRRAMNAHLHVTESPTIAPDPFRDGRVLIATWPGIEALFAEPRPGCGWRLWAIERLEEVDRESMRTNAGALVEALWPRREGWAA